jgi:hypothetical protein
MYPVAAVLQYTLQYNTVHKNHKIIPSKCDILPSEDVKITTNRICRVGTPGGRAVFEGWTNIEQREASGVSEWTLEDQ